ncbi:uncharacterized protein LOC125039353 [Penaeus chinensis]|uniref:uncharacterized protein LOC125039353 n=1 Tax=Penaeus chinensis TaxID=139456 RepID=UPI001FB693FE|nr:uncharacterized protein LOC125039353 [Penaeus chinensis]
MAHLLHWETRLADSGTLREKSYTFFWKGKPPEEPRQHGVGFAIRNTLMTSIEPPSAGTERILTLRLSTSFGSATIISVYAPTLYSTPEDKDQFYGALDDIISQTPSTDMLYILGDFNARVGADHEAWLSCLGAYGRGKINDNGQRLLELCCYHGLCVTNTFFPCREIHQVSWRHPRSRHWHQLDLVLTRRKDLASVLLTRTYHSADCDTDHSLVASKEHNHADWFEAHWDRMEPVVEAKRKTFLAYKNAPNPTTLTALRVARKTSQQTARHCANTYWLNLCSRIQLAADVGDASGMYEGIKKATGPAPSKSAPLKTKTGDVITDQGKQLKRWVEHYLELYAMQNVVTDAALADTPDLPVTEELDALPTKEELSKAISNLSSGKAPGIDSIPAEVLNSGKPALLEPLHTLLCKCWEKGYIPQDMRDANIVTLYKNKGDKRDCNNYRGISLLSIVGKVFARVTLARSPPVSTLSPSVASVQAGQQ